MDTLVSADSSKLFKTYLSDILAATIQTDSQMTQKLKNVHQEQSIEWFFKESKISFAPGLDKVLASETSPPIEFFINLPSAVDMDRAELLEVMLVYGLALEKFGEDPRLGIGSAAKQTTGAADRIQNYRGEIIWKLSRYTQQSLKEGFEITNVGVLIVVRLPPPGRLRPLMRALILTIEAGLTWTFWAVWQARDKKIEDHYMGHVCPWKNLEWKGLASHSPVSEDVAGIELSTEQILEKMDRTRERKKLYMRERYKNDHDRVRELIRNTPSYKRAHEQRKESRAIMRQYEAGEIELDDDVQEVVSRELKNREDDRIRHAKHRAEHKDELNAKERAADALKKEILQQFEDGELSEEDEDVQKALAQKARKQAASQKHSQKHKDAMAKFESGELDEEDEAVQKAIKSKRDAAERTRKYRERKKKKLQESKQGPIKA